MRSRFNQSKTGGQVTLQGLRNEDISTDPQFAQDEFNRLDLEIAQLDADKVKKVHRFVESLITGKFIPVNKEFDPNRDKGLKKKMDADGDGIVST